jgi:hypothetical protein
MLVRHMASIFFTVKSGFIFNHRCTLVENPGGRIAQVFANIPEGGQGYQEKLPGGSKLSMVLHSISEIEISTVGAA